jgi:hypothetical protein
VVYGSGLENRQGASLRGFESHPLRQLQDFIQSLVCMTFCVCRWEIRTQFDRWGALRARVKSEALELEPKRSFG